LDRVVVRIPEGGANYTTVGGTLSSSSVGVNTNFDASAPYFRIVIEMTDREFDVDSGNSVAIDSINLQLALKPFALANGSFEEDLTNPGASAPPNSWLQFPIPGVSKDILSNGTKIYNQTTRLEDASATSAAFAGTKVMKVFGQNYYPGGVWEGPSQTGTTYQEFLTSATPTLAAGSVIHARGVAKVFSIDPLTGGSTFSYGFKFMNSANSEIGRAVTTLTANNFTADKWLPLTVNATIPAGTEKVQLISEFVQNASTDLGAVYLDDLSIGFGTISPTATVGSSTYNLVWSDEFDGTALNSANWTPETGGGGWGNNEQQTYTSNSENLSVGGGSLLIQAKKSGTSWTSARIKSQEKRSFQYGKIEFRAKLPTGVGPWPAAWLLGNNISSVNWPACGEIDVMEWRGGFNGVPNGDANTVGHALHSATRNGSSPVEPTSRSAVVNPSSAFHTYAVVWTANNLVFSVDGVDKATLTPPTADAAAFQKEFFLILNLAMGGSYVGSTIASSVTSATYEVDYVRVYQAASATVTAPAAPATPTFSSVTSTGFTVNWGAVSGATSYKLDVSSSSSFATYVTQDLTVGTNLHAVSSLTPGTTYYARVRAVNSGGTSSSSVTGIQNTLTSYQQYLSGLGYSTSTAFNADANGDGVKEGIKYAFNAASPQLNSAPATITRSGNTLTYTFDIRNDSALAVVAQLSTNLTSWTDQASSVITNGTGAAAGYIRKIVTITTTDPKAFIRLQVTGN
jgi:beta-glucanase (GH16 family)